MTTRIFALLLVVSFRAFAAAPQPPSGRVVNVTGTATVNERLLRVSDPVYVGDIISTRPASSVKLLMHDRTILDVAESTSLTIKDYPHGADPGRNADIRLDFGNIRSSVNKKTDRGSKFYIRTKASVLAVRGTEFITSSRGEENGRRVEQITVVEGAVGVTPAAGGFPPVQLTPGRQWTLEGTMAGDRFHPSSPSGPKLLTLSAVEMAAVVEKNRSPEKTFVQNIVVDSRSGSGGATVAAVAQALKGRDPQGDGRLQTRDVNAATGQGIAGREIPGFGGLPGSGVLNQPRIPGTPRIPVEVVVRYAP